jgi:hypothetical protein
MATRDQKQSEGLIALAKMVEAFITSHPDFSDMRLESLGINTKENPTDDGADKINMATDDHTLYECNCHGARYVRREPCNPPCKPWRS